MFTYVYDRKRNKVSHEHLSNIKRYLDKSNYVIWVDLEHITDHECTMLQDVFSLHDLTIEDIQKHTSLPKIDEFDDYLFLIFHKLGFDDTKRKLLAKEIDFVLGKNYLISAHQTRHPSITTLQKKIDITPHFMNNGSDFLLHNIIDFFIDGYQPIIDHWDDELAQIEEDIIQGKTRQEIKRLLIIKKDIITFKKSITPQRDFMDKLLRAQTHFISKRARAYFKDVADHVHRAHVHLEAIRDISNSTFDAYMSMTNNKMAETSNKMNKVMQRLTLVSTIFLPLTFITGLYGMNFLYMPELKWHLGYFVVLALMFILAVLMLMYFKRHRWM